jgi:hypothetical protein
LPFPQYVRRKLARKNARSRIINAWGPSVLAQRQRMRVAKIYSTKNAVKTYKPKMLQMQRPAAFKAYVSPAGERLRERERERREREETSRRERER